MYKPHTGSDRRRYVEEVRLSLPIRFEVEHPSEWGIPLDDALKSRTKRLVDKDALMFDGCGPSVSIRLEVRSSVILLFKERNRIFDSGRVHHGAGRFLPRTSVVLQVPLQRPSWQRTSPNVFSASSRCIQTVLLTVDILTSCQDIQDKPVNEEEDANALRFKVGTGANDVKLEDLVLVSLHHVSQGSWQPHLRLRRQI